VSVRVPGESPAADRVLVVATRSVHKLGELRQLLHLPRTRLVSLDDVGVEEEAPEDGDTFEANAVFKARYYADLSGLPTLADDSGIEVDALDGGPGVRTRRYAGEQATDEDNNVKLLAALRGLPPERRGARYRCVLAFVEPAGETEGRKPETSSATSPPSVSVTSDPSGRPAADPPARHATVRRGTFEGRIADGPRGTGGFGYDPIFEPAWEQPGGRTVGLYSAEEKNRVSHRAAAARAMRRVLVERGY
jgi:XTP/dITP diphosphohydrolase